MAQESDIIRRVLEGDGESFRRLVDRYAGPVMRMVRNVTGDDQTCEDLAQEVFLTAYGKLRTFDPARSRFSTWLFTIARNKSVNAVRKKRPLCMAEPPERTGPDRPEDLVARHEFLAALDRELLALPLEQRTAFVLAEFEHLPYEQIAQIEGVRLGTVKSRVSRARDKLAALLSFIMVGLGQVYAGRLVRGLIFSVAFSAAISVSILLLAFAGPLPTVAFGVLVVAASLGLTLVGAWDAYRVAALTRPDYELKTYNQPVVYLLLGLLVMSNCLGFALHVRSSLFQAFRVSAASMRPTIGVNDRILVDKTAYRRARPQRGDIVVFHPPTAAGTAPFRTPSSSAGWIMSTGPPVAGPASAGSNEPGSTIHNPLVTISFAVLNLQNMRLLCNTVINSSCSSGE
ncbi:MAG: signal peptidase I [Sedimentisphaerales bacterium]|nr:signal peptidase I [Sedimentisphaerales bacterium]